MNTKVTAINEIIEICDKMIKVTQKYGVLPTESDLYALYRDKISDFLSINDLMREDSASFIIINGLTLDVSHFTNINLDIAKSIRKSLIDIKDELFANDYERIFISHREKDKQQVLAFIDLLYAIGIPRPVTKQAENVIFCTSHPAAYIKNGERNLEEIRNHINSDQHTLFILWYTDNYFKSQACLNEAGAIWAGKKRYQEILSPNFCEKKIKGLLDKQPVWFRAHDKDRLNIFKQQIESWFNLPSIELNEWERVRDDYIKAIKHLTIQEGNMDAHA